MRAVLLALSLSSAASAVPIINYCDVGVSVAYARSVGGGVDSIGENATSSWRRIESYGWANIPPNSTIESDGRYTHIIVRYNDVTISRTDVNSPDTMGACVNIKSKFDRKLDVGGSNPWVTQCFYEPGMVRIAGVDTGYRWLPYQKIQGYSKYELKNCVAQKRPELTRFTWQSKANPERFYTWQQGKEWARVDPGNQRRDDERGILDTQDANWIVIKRPYSPGVEIVDALGETNRKYTPRGGNNVFQWRDEEEGHWIE